MATYTRSSTGASFVFGSFTNTIRGRTWYDVIPFTAVYTIDGIWHFEWAVNTGAVRIVVWGQELEIVTANEYTYAASRLFASLDFAPPLEVVPVNVLATSEKNKPWLLMQWYRVDCHHYAIEYYENGEWVQVSTVTDDPAIFIQTFITPIMVDQTEVFWRVVALDDNRRESDPLPFHTIIVRPPDIPEELDLTCVAGDLTVDLL